MTITRNEDYYDDEFQMGNSVMQINNKFHNNNNNLLKFNK